MSQSKGNTYLHTRVSVMAARLLKPGDLQHLAQLDAEQLGKRFGLTAMLDDNLPAPSRNRAVERALIRTLLNELAILVRPMNGEARSLVLYWARKYELYNLKALIRGKLSGLNEQAIKDNLYELPENLTLPHKTLLRAESVLELLRHLEHSPYSAIASQARHVYEERHEPFALEATIDQRYFAGLVKRVRELPGDDLKAMQQLVGLLLDQLNLPWLLRYRFSYGLSASEAYYQLAPSSRQMHRGALLKLVNLASFDKVIEALPEPLNQLLEGVSSCVDVEHRLEARSGHLIAAILRHSPSSITRALAYLVLREQDLKKLFAMVQANLLGLDSRLLSYAIGLDSAPAPKETANA